MDFEATIRKHATDFIIEEVEYRQGLFDPDEHDEGVDPYSFSEAFMMIAEDIDDGVIPASRKEIKIVRTILIEVGFYRIIEQDEMDRTTLFSSSGRSGKKYDFKMNGVHYTSDSTWSGFQAERADR